MGSHACPDLPPLVPSQVIPKKLKFYKIVQVWIVHSCCCNVEAERLLAYSNHQITFPALPGHDFLLNTDPDYVYIFRGPLLNPWGWLIEPRGFGGILVKEHWYKFTPRWIKNFRHMIIYRKLYY